MKIDFKAVRPHLAAVLFFIAFSCVYFLPALQGEKIGSTDNLGWQGMAKEFSDYRKATGDPTQWTTSMFGGMPTYTLGNTNNGNYVSKLNQALQFYNPGRPIGMFFIASLCFYLLMLSLKVRPLIAAVGAIAFAYSTFHLILYAEGHANKVKVIAYLPLVMTGLILAFQNRKYLLGGLVFTLGMAFCLTNNHPQMVYYFGLTLLIFGGLRLYQDLKAGDIKHFLMASAAMVVGVLIAAGSTASNLMTTQEYQSESVRGRVLLSSAGDNDRQDDGFAWERAMSWSNGPKDVLASFIPMAAGGGRATVSRDSEYGKLLSRAGAQPRDGRYQAPLYHGSMSFTVGPKYFGTIVLMLFFLGLILVRKSIGWWFAGGALLILLISMGKHASWLNRPLFDTLPLFNKFRAPDSAMSLSLMLLLPMGLLGLKEFLDLRRSDATLARRKLFIAGGISIGIGLLGALVLPSMINFSNPGDAQQISAMFGGQADTATVNSFINALEDTRVAVFRSDAFYVLGFAVAGFIALWLILTQKINETVGIVALGALAFLDFHFINQRYHSHDEYQPIRSIQGYFDPTAADNQILADPDPHYRVYNTSPANGQPFSDSKTSYLHKSIGGYNAVKLRRYDDLINRQLSRGNQSVFNMLNTKYYLVNGPNGQPQAQRNPGALGNAWFVDNIQYVNSHDEEMAALNEFDPGSTAIVKADEFQNQLSGLDPSPNGEITLTSYAPNRLTYTSSNAAEGLAVFSEIWYGPDLGWEVTINGEPAELVRANYVLRALRVPAGNHEIEMVFNPKSFSTGRTLSTIFSLLIIFGLLGYAGYWFWSNNKGSDPSPPPAQPDGGDEGAAVVQTATKSAKKKSSSQPAKVTTAKAKPKKGSSKKSKRKKK
ncbi:MAG: YfhO family protein [Bacteroidota bacterium]